VRRCWNTGVAAAEAGTAHLGVPQLAASAVACTLLGMTTLAAGLGPDAVDGMLWVAGILLVVGILAMVVSRRRRRPGDGTKEKDG
jgi:hypothetical protein